MRIVLVAAFAALAGGPAFAQMPSLATSVDKPVTQDDVDRNKKRDEGYRAGLGQIPDQKGDPWGNVRNAAPPPAKQAKPAQKANPK